MRSLLVLVVAGAAFAAPVEDKENSLRTKKSYGASYGSPCAGAQPLAPVALYLSPQAGPSIPHYREDEHKEEHTEQRSYYGGLAPSAAAIAAPGAGIAAASPGAIGVFPNAKVGGCAVPLLLSCAPSVHSGHIAHHSAYAAPAAYRDPEQPQHAKMIEETKMREAVMQRANEVPAMEPHQHHVLAMDVHALESEKMRGNIERPHTPVSPESQYHHVLAKESMMREAPAKNWEQSQRAMEHGHSPAMDALESRHHHHVMSDVQYSDSGKMRKTWEQSQRAEGPHSPELEGRPHHLLTVDVHAKESSKSAWNGPVQNLEQQRSVEHPHTPAFELPHPTPSGNIRHF